MAISNAHLTVIGGGMFSLIHQFIEGIIELQLTNADNLKISVGYHKIITNVNIFESIFTFSNDAPYNVYHRNITSNRFVKANVASNFSELRQVVSKLPIQPSIISKVDAFCMDNSIDRTVLGVHIRLTDMNIAHAHDYNVVSFDHYVNAIQNHLNEHTDVNTIFVAADNDESICKLQDVFSSYKIVSYPNITRISKESDDNLKNQINMMNNPEFYIENMTEVLILARCGALIHRISDFANFAILKSDTYDKIICLN